MSSTSPNKGSSLFAAASSSRYLVIENLKSEFSNEAVFCFLLDYLNKEYSIDELPYLYYISRDEIPEKSELKTIFNIINHFCPKEIKSKFKELRLDSKKDKPEMSEDEPGITKLEEDVLADIGEVLIALDPCRCSSRLPKSLEEVFSPMNKQVQALFEALSKVSKNMNL